MSKKVISVEQVWKQYRLGTVNTGMLGQDLKRWMARISGKEDPFGAIAEKNDRSVRSESDFVWALQDINFSVNEGDVLGIVGKNGAGKSTMLKLLSRVTSPTKGLVKIKGRIASLLEVGTGFHPDLTGKENIFMNGAILGMRKKEIESKLEEIIAFSGVERYIDTPVKRYSSGMYVRLAFAVAAHLEPEILIVDEVLAVGDAEFQKKCLGKMKDVAGKGRTIIFVSHNLTALRSLCPRSLLFEQGMLVAEGTTTEIIGRYLGNETSVEQGRKIFSSPVKAGADLELHAITVLKNGVQITSGIAIEESAEIEFLVKKDGKARIDLTLQFCDNEGQVMFVTGTGMNEENPLKEGMNKLKCVLPASFFNSGVVHLNLLVVKDRNTTLLKIDDVMQLVFVDNMRQLGQWMGRAPGFIKPKFEWSC